MGKTKRANKTGQKKSRGKEDDAETWIKSEVVMENINSNHCAAGTRKRNKSVKDGAASTKRVKMVEQQVNEEEAESDADFTEEAETVQFEEGDQMIQVGC